MPSCISLPDKSTTITVGKITIKLSVHDGLGRPSAVVSVHYRKKGSGETGVLWDDGYVLDAFNLRETFELYDRPVGEFDFSIRVFNCFARDGIVYMGDLCQRSNSDLLKMKHFGLKSLKEVEAILSRHKLCLDAPSAFHWQSPRLVRSVS